MAAHGNLVDLASEIKAISTVPESYFQPSKELPKDTLSSLKRLFDFSRQNDFTNGCKLCPLRELMVDGFDDEQIWQQIELQNEPVISDTRKKVKDIKKTGLNFRLLPLDAQNGHDDNDGENLGVEFEDSTDDNDVIDSNEINNRVMMPASSSEDEEEEGDFMAQETDDDDDDDESDNDKIDNDDEQLSRKHSLKHSNKNDCKREKKVKMGGSIVDDKFFKLSEMTEFLDKMDQDFEQKQDGKIDDDDGFDYFRDIESDEEEDDDDEQTDDGDDDDDWGEVLGATAKIMGRNIKKDVKKTKSKTAAEIKYSDYFDPPDGEEQITESDVENSEEDDDDEVEEDHYKDSDDDDSMNVEDVEMMDDENEDEKNNNESLSRHEREQLKLKKKIALLEKENLSTKPWQMSGEAEATARPFNSLLEEDLNFDHTTAVAPPITEETTKSLETVIKQRIKDESWDDVERKQKPVTQPYEYKKKLPLDQEKSKLSLSQIYEQEYVKQTQAQEGPKEEEEIVGHKEIKELMAKLFTKLDALSNFHFTPKPLKPEVKIVTNTPVISMEEVAPVVASDAMLLAPEEAHEKKVELKGDAEKTDSDRKRERRAKKLKQRLKAKEQEKKKKLVNKLNPGLGNKYAKKKALKNLEKESKSSKNISVISEDGEERTLKSSSAFFSRLHDEVKQQVNSKKGPGEKKKKKSETNISKLKL